MSQIFSLKTQMKTSYVSYLQNLCHANSIDIQLLKTDGPERQKLEMFFGSYPVLVGLKYFTNLNSLCLFGQQITCLKPLGEVCTTLEELWICEGHLKSLDGLGHCKKLKKLYLYENEIENASEIGELANLEVLSLQNNFLRNLKFLEKLPILHTLNVASNNLGDEQLGTVSRWPSTLRSVDISSNNFRTFQYLFPLSDCSSICNFSLLSPHHSLSSFNYSEELYDWLSYHFRFLEKLDEDEVSDSFFITHATKACVKISSETAKLAKLEDSLYRDCSTSDRHANRVVSKLTKMIEALDKIIVDLPSKDVKREVVKRTTDAFRANLILVKKMKKNYKKILKFGYKLSHYRLSIHLEAGSSEIFPEISEEDLGTIKHFLNFNCSAKQQYEIIIRSALIRRPLVKGEIHRLAIVDKSKESRIYTENDLFDLLNHYQRNQESSNRVFFDFELLRKELTTSDTVLALPIVSINQNGNSKNEKVNKINDETFSWKDLELLAVVMVEFSSSSAITTDYLKFNDKFDVIVEEEIRKLKEFQINLDIREDNKPSRVPCELTFTSVEDSVENKTGQSVTVKDVANLQNLKNKWSSFSGFSSRLTLRNALEISLAFSQLEMEPNSTDFYSNVTSLDLSGVHLNKLLGIEALPNLVNLSLRNNRLCSIKKLKILENLEFLDASCNKILRADQLPTKLKHLNLSQNHLVSLQFCVETQGLEVLNVSRNQIKSLKGLEHCGNLNVLIAHDNQLKDKLEIDHMKTCAKLTYIDFIRNKITSLDGYRAKLLFQFPLLSALDREIIPVEDRVLTFNKSGRGLTLEVLRKNYPNLEEVSKVTLIEHKLEIIVMDESCLNKMSQITELDLSKNQFENVKKLGYMTNLKSLNLSKNQIKLLWSQSKADEAEDIIPFANVEFLDLSGNELNNSLLSLIGLQHFQSLKKLVLDDNLLTIFDSSLFDLPYLQTILIQRNLIKIIKRKCLNQMSYLDLSNNRLKDINGLVCPNLKNLNISHNCITTCSALKPISSMTILQNLDCSANPVISHRVYVDFIKSQAASIEMLDTKQISSYIPIDKRRLSAVNLEHEKERNASLLSNSFVDWEETLLTPKSESFNFVLRPRSFGNRLSVNGIKMTKHRKSFGN